MSTYVNVVGISPLAKSGVVQFSAPLKRPEQPSFLLLCGREAILEARMHSAFALQYPA